MLVKADTSRVLLIAALRDELSACVRRLALKRGSACFEGASNGRTITAATIGVGAIQAELAARRLIERHRPSALILIGFSGGLDNTLNVADAVHPLCVVDGASRLYHLTPTAPPQPGDAAAPRDSSTAVLSANHVITLAQEKRQLGELHRACAVDMESFAIAGLACELRLPLRIVRAISDPADIDLPPQVATWINADGSPRIGAAIASLLRRPTLLPAMLKLRNHTRAAADRLAIEVETMLRSGGAPTG